MSTRATYTITDKRYDEIARKDFYIHYDGYPEGAAVYFEKFINCENERGTAIEKFIRAIDLAEFTNNANNHGDREYHYNFDNTTQEIMAYKVNLENYSKFLIFSGNLADFLNQYLPAEETVFGNKKKNFIHYENNNRAETIQREKLSKKLDTKISNNLSWLAGGHLGNVRGAIEELKHILAYVPNNNASQRIAFIEETCNRLWIKS